MNYKNKKLLLIAAAIITISFILYLSSDMSPYNRGNFYNFEQVDSEERIVDSINIQNNTLTNYFNSLYDSQISDINNKYDIGSISLEERNKQVNAVKKNRELTLNTLNKLSIAKKELFTGNVTKEDIILKINSLNDINTDIKTEINATLNGY